jgi:hypothetical protein
VAAAPLSHFDLGVGDPITPGPKSITTKPFISPNEGLSWSVYPFETIIAEKLHALIAHEDANSRSKDVHDPARAWMSERGRFRAGRPKI